MATLTLELAEECIRRVKQEATGMDISLSIAVVNEASTLVAYARMGDRPGHFGERLAIAKALTALAFQRTTQECLERFGQYPANNYIVTMSSLYPGEFCVTPGGAPIVVDGRVIGAVGVSGSTPENDHVCTVEALKGFRVE